MDVDIVAMIHPIRAEELSRSLKEAWYSDPEQIRQAIAAGRSFNLIYIPRSVKVDIFPAVDEFGLAQVERATLEILPLCTLLTPAA